MPPDPHSAHTFDARLAHPTTSPIILLMVNDECSKTINIYICFSLLVLSVHNLGFICYMSAFVA